MTRLSIEIDPVQYQQIKTLASGEGLSVKDYILAKTLPAKTEALDVTQQLLGSPRNAARLRSAIKTPRSRHQVFNSIKELKDALGL